MNSHQHIEYLKHQQRQPQRRLIFGSFLLLAMTAISVHAQVRDVGVSPWGPTDEIGRLNLITAESRANVLSRVDGSAAYDLSVEYFIGT